MVFKRLFGASATEAFRLTGERVYAVGDVHGRLDCLEAVLAKIDADETARGPAPTHIVLLGDLIDRGPDSRGVVERARRLAAERPTTILAGNHEELLLRAAKGDRTALATFDRAGGRETLLSYGVEAADYDDCALADLPALIARAVPADHLAFLAGLDDWLVKGDYLFVHAGVRPGVPLDQQDPNDLRWIREPFLSHKGRYGSMVIHGHTITAEPDIRPNRIGIDTGAFASGVLTAIGLEDEERWFLRSG